MTIVVGVDGSSAAEHALAWAIDEARRRPAPLQLVHAWTYAIGGHAAVAETLTLLADASQALLDGLVAEARTSAPDLDITGTPGPARAGVEPRSLVVRDLGGAAGRGRARSWWLRRSPARLGEPPLRARGDVPRRGRGRRVVLTGRDQDFRPCYDRRSWPHAPDMTTIDADVRPERVELSDGGAVDLWTYADDERVTVTAWTPTGDLVGLAWFDTTPSSHPKVADVEVTPSQHRRGIGTVLFRQLVAEATERSVAMITWTHPADDVAVRHLEMASDAACARRVDRGRTKSTIFVPAA